MYENDWLTTIPIGKKNKKTLPYSHILMLTHARAKKNLHVPWRKYCCGSQIFLFNLLQMNSTGN